VKEDKPVLAKDGKKLGARANNPGGARPGAGRKPRQTVKQSREAAARINAGGAIDGGWDGLDEARKNLPRTATPLDVMIEAMRRAYYLGGPVAAFPFAKEAAPYLHARISSIELKPGMPGQPTAPTQGSIGFSDRFKVNFVKPTPQPVPPADDDVVDV
jgi:hypothetical protein